LQLLGLHALIHHGRLFVAHSAYAPSANDASVWILVTFVFTALAPVLVAFVLSVPRWAFVVSVFATYRDGGWVDESCERVSSAGKKSDEGGRTSQSEQDQALYEEP
jgi:hypothetical protein